MTRLRIVVFLALILVTAGVVALAVQPSSDDGVTSSPASTSTTTRPVGSTSTTRNPPSTTTTPNPLGSGRAVTFAFGGDVHFEGMIRPQLDANLSALLAPVAPSLSGADIAMVNLETAITERGTPANKTFVFRAPASGLTALKSAGVDVASEANNHGLDYGLVGLEDSVNAAKALRFPVIGIGNNDTEAYKPFRTTVNGQRIAIIGATQVLDNSLITAWTAGPNQPGLASAKEVERLLTAVREARRTSDTLVVFLHWGIETQTCPSVDQQTLATQLTQAGADIVVGSHAHRVQGGGRMGGAVVHYGLGNFVFYSRGGPATTSGIFHVTATGRRIDDYRWEPAVISNGIARPLSGADVQTGVDSWNALRGCTGLQP